MMKNKTKGKRRFKTRTKKRIKMRSKRRLSKQKRGGGNKCNILIVNHENYKDYAELLSSINMCDNTYVSDDLEQLSYDVLEYEGNIGFFCVDPQTNQISSVLCVDINNNENTQHLNTSEIMLLCSNKNHRVSGASRELFNSVLQYLQSIGKKSVSLYVAKPTINKQATSFYEKMGFKIISEKTGLMRLDFV